MLEWYNEDREISQWEFLAKKKKELVEREEQKKTKLAEKRAALADRETPYSAEIELCDDLVKYLHKLKVQHGLVDPEDDELAKQVNIGL